MLINSGGAITERNNGEQGRIYEIASKQARGGGRVHGINKAATTNGSHLVYRLVLCVPYGTIKFD